MAISALRHAAGTVIGERLRQALNCPGGDKVTLVTHKLNENGTIAPRYTDYELLASFLTRRYEFDGALVFVPLQMLQDDLEYGHQAVSSIDLDIADPAAAPRMAAEICARRWAATTSRSPTGSASTPASLAPSRSSG